MKDFRVMFISADTLYYLLEKPDMSLLGINHVGIHYSKIDFSDYRTAIQEEVYNWLEYDEHLETLRDEIGDDLSF